MTRSLIALAAFALLVVLAPHPARADDQALEVDGRTFDRTISVEHGDATHELVATGKHKRKKFFFSIYAAVAYARQDLVEALPADADDVGAVLLERGAPMRMHLKMLRGLDATRITNGINEALEKTATRPLEEIADERARFVELFDGELDEDQSLVMTWLPDAGLEIRIDEEVLDTIPGDDFARAFFEIYFGPKPIDDGMKEDLLEEIEA